MVHTKTPRRFARRGVGVGAETARGQDTSSGLEETPARVVVECHECRRRGAVEHDRHGVLSDLVAASFVDRRLVGQDSAVLRDAEDHVLVAAGATAGNRGMRDEPARAFDVVMVILLNRGTERVIADVDLSELRRARDHLGLVGKIRRLSASNSEQTRR